jgi:hypothetical protein
MNLKGFVTVKGMVFRTKSDTIMVNLNQLERFFCTD